MLHYFRLQTNLSAAKDISLFVLVSRQVITTSSKCRFSLDTATITKILGLLCRSEAYLATVNCPNATVEVFEDELSALRALAAYARTGELELGRIYQPSPSRVARSSASTDPVAGTTPVGSYPVDDGLPAPADRVHARACCNANFSA